MELMIRKMKHSDLWPLYDILSDSRVMQYLEPPFSLEQTQAFLEEHGLSAEPRIFAVEDAHDTFVGYIIYHDYDENSVEIGWVLQPRVWGQGYASALTLQLTEKAAAARKDVIIECVPEQEATKAIAEKYGFSLADTSDGLLVYKLKTKSPWI